MREVTKTTAPLSKSEMHRIATERVAEIAREFNEGFEILEDYPKSVTFFGSTRSSETDPYYQSARTLSNRLVKELGYTIVSGGGPGIMEAADRGAYDAGGDSIGLLIKLPNGQPTNPYIKKSVSFHYFFARKVSLAFGAEVFIFYPGGFGTFDEFFEIITLIQTQKILKVPVICVGSEYWNKIKDYMRKEMFERGMIDKGDMEIFTIMDDHDQIIELVKKVPVRDGVPFGPGRQAEHQK
jgi:uncharacterized protein (TIGR00730 family)